MSTAIARVHVDDYDPEVYTGDDALEIAMQMANVFRKDFPEATVGVSYNPQVALDRKNKIRAYYGATSEED